MAIEKLKNKGDVLDMTAPPQDTSGTSKKQKKETVINMAPQSKPKKESKMKVSTSGGSRNKVSIADLKGEEKVVHGNPNISKVNKEADDILDLTNPNSMFNRYYNNKVEEYTKRMEEEEEKIRDAVETGELDRNSEVAKSWLGEPEEDDKINTVRTEDIEFDDDEEEEIIEEDDDGVDVTDNFDFETGKEVELDEIEFEEDEEEMSDEENKVEELEGMDISSVTKEETVEEDPVMKALVADEDEDVIDSEEDDDEYEDEDIDLSDDIDDEEEDEEEVDNTKAFKTVNNKTEIKSAKEETNVSSVLKGVDLSITSKKSDIKDDDEEEEEESSNPQNDELVNKLRRMATEKLKPKTAAIDISNFAIGKASVKNINPVISIKENKIAKWVLINQEQIVLMREFSGVDLQTFVETANSNTASSFSRRMRLLFNHIESPKPNTFEAWLKSTPYSDIDHYYFGVYVASFNGANYMPIDCAGGTKCPEGTFVSDDVPIMDLVKFTKDDAKKKFKKIYKEEQVLDNPEGKFVYNIVPVNGSIAVGFKEPMLYDFIETISIDDTFSRKYSSVIQLAPYIDKFYVINANNGTLDPIAYNEYANNAAKTYRSKIRKFNTILSYLSSDEYAMIEAYANDIRDMDDGITYITPSLTCPYCGTESEEVEMTAETLVFTRYQLGALVNTTLK